MARARKEKQSNKKGREDSEKKHENIQGKKF